MRETNHVNQLICSFIEDEIPYTLKEQAILPLVQWATRWWLECKSDFIEYRHENQMIKVSQKMTW